MSEMENNYLGIMPDSYRFLVSDGKMLRPHLCVFAIYCEDDNSLTFYTDTFYPKAGRVYNGKYVSNIYTGFDTEIYSSSVNVPWFDIIDDVKYVITDVSFSNIYPVSTDYWFSHFFNCESFDLTNLNTSKIITMNDMFYYCSSVEYLDVSKFDTSNVTSMRNMFGCCSKISELDVSNFDTSNVTNMQCMFGYCDALVQLDVSNFDTHNVTNMADMFSKMGNITIIYSNDANFVTSSLLSGYRDMFYESVNLIGGNGTTYDSNKHDYTMAHVDTDDNPGYFTERMPFAIFSTDDNSLTFYKGSRPDTGTLYNGKTVTNVYTGFDQTSASTRTDVPWNDIRDSIVSVSFDSSFKVVRPISTAFWFCYLTSCTEIDLANLNTNDVTEMQQMFRMCPLLTELDLSSMNIDKVERISNMLINDSALQTLDISGWNTGNILYMNAFVRECSSLKTIYADRDFVINANLQNDANMFYECTSLIGGNGTKYDSSKITSSMAHIDTTDNPGYFTKK